MQLRQAEAFGVLDYHDSRIGDVDAHLDYRGRDQNLQLAPLEHAHDLILQLRIEASVEQSHFQIGKYVAAEVPVHFDCSLQFAFFILCNHGIHDVGLMPGCHLLPHKVPHLRRLIICDLFGDDGRTAGGQLIENAEIKVAIQRECQGAGNRGSSHN